MFELNVYDSDTARRGSFTRKSARGRVFPTVEEDGAMLCGALACRTLPSQTSIA